MTVERDYWYECIAQAAEECDLTLMDDQLECLADAAKSAHEHYGQAFYSPPSCDYATSVEREWKAKYAELERRLRDQQDRTDIAVRRLCRLDETAIINIDQYGNVEAR